MTKQNRSSYSPAFSIFFGGMMAGTLDIIYAFVKTGLPPLRVLQSVASGLLGSDAFQGGTSTAALGLFCHMAISIGAAAVFFMISRQFSLLIRKPLFSGAVFGICVYLFMNFIVLPLSAVPFKMVHDASSFLYGFASHAILFGIPIAYCIRRYGSK
ncbi:MAG: hypothetical protein ACREPB_04930 [Arenimonas sp.]